VVRAGEILHGRRENGVILRVGREAVFSVSYCFVNFATSASKSGPVSVLSSVTVLKLLGPPPASTIGRSKILHEFLSWSASPT
jgi:hypothetical protein